MSKIDYRQSNKPVIKINRVTELQRENPNMAYALVRVDQNFDPNGTHLEEYLNNNWELVMDEDQSIVNDYDSTKSRKSSDKPSYVTRNGKGGAQFVLVTKSKEQQAKDEKARVERDNQRFKNSTVGRKIEQKGGNMTITDPEANINNKLD